MADTLASRIAASIGWNFDEALDLSVTVEDHGSLSYAETLVDGTAIDTADKVWHDERTILTGADDDLDLTALTYTLFGSTVTINFAKVKAILIVNRDTDTGDELVVKASATNGFAAWANGVTTSNAFIGPDGALLMSNKKDGWTVDATHKVLRITNPNAGSVIYRIAILGTSA